MIDEIQQWYDELPPGAGVFGTFLAGALARLRRNGERARLRALKDVAGTIAQSGQGGSVVYRDRNGGELTVTIGAAGAATP